jgi:TolB-like protein
VSFFSELKRRNVTRVAVAYGVITWLLLQVSDVLVDALELPGAWSKALIALLLIGFIPAMVFSWVYEMTPEGIKKESEVTPDASVAAHTAKKLDIVVIMLLVLAIGLFAVDRFVGRGTAPALTQGAPGTQSTATETIRAPQPTEVANPTSKATSDIPVVAVLPLKSMSTDQEGTFLASGLHDDLLTKLAKLQAFRVISRTSVMEYAGTTKNIREIGQELGAGFILEGGLQAIGGRVSINAQLIDANTDEHLWAETFTRELTTANLFDVQAEIASAISTALHATLSPTDIATIKAVPTENMAAYRAYLRGLETSGLLSRPSMQATIDNFGEAVRLDPNYADAWARLSEGHIRLYWEEGAEDALAPDPANRDAAGEALARAEALAPKNVQVLLSHALYRYYGYRDYAGALSALVEAAAMAPYDEQVIAARGYVLRRLGRLDEAADALLQALELAPNSGDMREAMLTLRAGGRCDEAVTLMNRALNEYPDDSGIILTSAWVEMNCNGDADTARALVDQVNATTLEELFSQTGIVTLQRDFPAAIAYLERARTTIAEGSDQAANLIIEGELAWQYRQTGQLALSDAAIKNAEAASEGLPRNSAILMQLALVEALKGNTDETIRLGALANAALPDDAFARPWFYSDLARTHAIAGANEEALSFLEKITTGTRNYVVVYTVQLPALDTLHEDPRFIAVMEQIQSNR